MSDRRPGRPKKDYETEKMQYRVRKDLKIMFSEICDKKGYDAQKQLNMMLELWIKKESGESERR